MRIYRVGGAVRDELLGLPVKDRDWVVVGARPEDLIDLGYRPVGKDFPVFLHPGTHEEYALARTERKVAPGYHGFAFHAAPDVTLIQDLERRDLTINAMARDEDGSLVDPFGGAADLAAGILRHVGPAFVEDPVRILRVARFAARFGFGIADATLGLMRAMVAAGEADALVPERVWQELSRGLLEARPSLMIAALRECGALGRILPELDALYGVPQRPESHPEIDTGVHVGLVVDAASRAGYDLAVRFAALVHDLGKGATPPSEWPDHRGHEEAGAALVEAICARLRVPSDCRELAVLTARHHGEVHRALGLDASRLADLLARTDAYRRPERFARLIDACEADSRGRTGFEDAPYPQREALTGARTAAAAVPAARIAASHPHDVPAALARARVDAIARWLAERPEASGDAGR